MLDAISCKMVKCLDGSDDLILITGSGNFGYALEKYLEGGIFVSYMFMGIDNTHYRMSRAYFSKENIW